MGMSMKNIRSGFKITGIYPFDPKALIPDSVTDNDPISFDPSSLCQQTGVKYIPL
jgi:hypothetical protein